MNGNPIAYESVDVTGETCWVAEHPAVPGPYAIGSTAPEAFELLEKALEVWRRVHGSGDGDGADSDPVTSGDWPVIGQVSTFTFHSGTVAVHRSEMTRTVDEVHV